MRLIPLPYQILGTILLCATAYALGVFRGASDVRKEWEQDKQAQEIKAAQAKAQSAEQTVKVVTEYVDRIQKVEVRVPVVRDRVVRVCDQAAGNRSGVPAGTGDPHARAPADPDDRGDHVADALAKDFIACRTNTETLRALQGWQRAHGG